MALTFISPKNSSILPALLVTRQSNLLPSCTANFCETAIMLCKAAMMGDAVMYRKIAAAETAKEAKQLGHSITPWDAERWDNVVCGVAVAVLMQKFGTVPKLRQILLETGDDKFLCEATAHDTRWAIGINIKMRKVYEVPARWKGSNILGWALMQVRSVLRDEEQLKAEQATSGG